MFEFTYKICLRDTDATGVLYFSKLLEIAQMTFVEMLEEKLAFSLKEMIESGDFLLPIRHVEADYKKPIFIGDLLIASINVVKVGRSSLEHVVQFFREGVLVGEVKTVHVKISKTTLLPSPLDLKMRSLRESCS